MSQKQNKILIISSVSSTLWVFYRGLIRELTVSGYEVTIAASDDYNLSRFRDKYRCRTINLDIKRSVSPLQDIRCIVQLYRLMRKEKFDVVHAHTPKAGMIGMIASWLAKVPVRIYTLHGLPLETAAGLKRKLFRAVERLTFKATSHRLIVSNSLAHRAVQLKLCKQSDFSILGEGSACGVDRTRFNSAAKTPESIAHAKGNLNIPQEAVVIGLVGRITPDKGIDCLLDMFEKLSQKYGNLYLLIIADIDRVRGESVGQYQQRISSHPRIKHLTFVDDIVPFYHAMDLLVLPSKREGFNYALLEAAACGLPTVTTNVTGCVDVVQDGRTGFVVQLGDQHAFNDAVEKLIQDSRLRRQLGQNAEQRVANSFDSKRLIQEHMNLYKDLLSQHH